MTDSIALSTGTVAPDRFRDMMRGFPTGVAVVTAVDLAGSPRGMTCSSLCSVSLRPPTLLVCLRAGSPTLAAAQTSGMFAVNLLHDGAQGTAELFASGEPDRFDRVGWRLDGDAAGPYLLDEVHAVADCRVNRALLVGDHVAVFGETTRIDVRVDGRPLLYGLRRYRGWPE
jgi:flavin reductase (DIM6/NTAB) family NADH-FMN oxidoreductase RutF